MWYGAPHTLINETHDMISIWNHVLLCILSIYISFEIERMCAQLVKLFQFSFLSRGQFVMCLLVSFIFFFLFSFCSCPYALCYLSIYTKPCANRQYNGQIEKTAIEKKYRLGNWFLLFPNLNQTKRLANRRYFA